MAEEKDAAPKRRATTKEIGFMQKNSFGLADNARNGHMAAELGENPAPI
jgi:hypothetical protein